MHHKDQDVAQKQPGFAAGLLCIQIEDDFA